jgi:uncharacterized membrane protein YcaP (DUF421 family)
LILIPAGRFIDENMQHCQLTRDKFNSELRQQGYISLATVFAVTLEPPGKVAVITQSEAATVAPPQIHRHCLIPRHCAAAWQAIKIGADASHTC